MLNISFFEVAKNATIFNTAQHPFRIVMCQYHVGAVAEARIQRRSNAVSSRYAGLSRVTGITC